MQHFLSKSSWKDLDVLKIHWQEVAKDLGDENGVLIVDGGEALQEIKADQHLRHIPIMILTTSQAEEDILVSYDIGAAGFISKPVTFEGLVDIIKKLGEYWVQIVKLPPKKAGER